MDVGRQAVQQQADDGRSRAPTQPTGRDDVLHQQQFESNGRGSFHEALRQLAAASNGTPRLWWGQLTLGLQRVFAVMATPFAALPLLILGLVAGHWLGQQHAATIAAGAASDETQLACLTPSLPPNSIHVVVTSFAMDSCVQRSQALQQLSMGRC